VRGSSIAAAPGEALLYIRDSRASSLADAPRRADGEGAHSA
jgi:hypothetical protein